MAPRAPVPHVCRPARPRSLLERVAVALLAPFVGPLALVTALAVWLGSTMRAWSVLDKPEAGVPIQSGLWQTDFTALVDGYNRTGVISGCGVTAQGSPDMTVAVVAGRAEVAGVHLTVTASATLAIGAADATNPRFDLIIAASTGVPTVVAGTAAASPLVPDPSAGAVILARVYVPATDTTIGANQITDLRVILGSRGTAGIFGNGADGDVTISGTTTLSRDMDYDNLTIVSGGILKPAGFRIRVRNLCQIDPGGLLASTPADGLAIGSASVGVGSGTLGAGAGGGAGGTAAGAAGSAAATSSLGGSGGNGGTGTGGAGGAGGTATPPAAALGNFKAVPYSVMGYLFGPAGTQFIRGGAGGGGGGGDGTSGGGGGGGGGPIVLAARHLINNGAIESKGSAGGTPAAGNRGGGGGGGGGCIILTYMSKQGSGTTSVVGGSKGLKSGTGTDGVDGSAGTLVEVLAA